MNTLTEIAARLRVAAQSIDSMSIDLNSRALSGIASEVDEIAAALDQHAAQAVKVPDREGCHGLDTTERVCFYEQEFYVLSNFSSFRVEYRGIDFDTSEHAYHFAKFNGYAPLVETMIRYARSAHQAFKIAEENKACRRADWDAVKVDVMREILRAKADQHEYVRRKLLETGDRELVENSWRDDFWGWGPNRDGKNMLGKLWMGIREELRAAIDAARGK